MSERSEACERAKPASERSLRASEASELFEHPVGATTTCYERSIAALINLVALTTILALRLVDLAPSRCLVAFDPRGLALKTKNASFSDIPSRPILVTEFRPKNRTNVILVEFSIDRIRRSLTHLALLSSTPRLSRSPLPPNQFTSCWWPLRGVRSFRSTLTNYLSIITRYHTR